MTLQIPVLDAGTSPANIELTSDLFTNDYNETLVHQLVTKMLADWRSGTRAQKSRSEVSGGGAKPWRQKGTGRARSGTRSSPIWRSGGVTFAAKTQSHKQKLNKKMYKTGMRSIVSELIRQNRFFIKNDITPKEPKTKLMVEKLKGIDARKILIVTDFEDKNLELASRNIPNLEISTADTFNPVSLVSAECVIVTEPALKKIEELLS